MLSPENLKKQIEQFWPIKGPSAKEVSKYIKKYQDEKIVIKCGGKVLGVKMMCCIPNEYKKNYESSFFEGNFITGINKQKIIKTFNVKK